jgi:polyferredoxin
MTESVVSLTAIQNYIIYYSVLLLILILNFIFGRRAFCHYLCWMAPFMALGKSISRYLWVIPAVHIKSEQEKCTECGACSRVCPMGLSVSQMAKTNEFQHIDCINCMNCVDTCPQDVLRVGFFKSRPKKKVLESDYEEI